MSEIQPSALKGDVLILVQLGALDHFGPVWVLPPMFGGTECIWGLGVDLVVVEVVGWVLLVLLPLLLVEEVSDDLLELDDAGCC